MLVQPHARASPTRTAALLWQRGRAAVRGCSGLASLLRGGCGRNTPTQRGAARHPARARAVTSSGREGLSPGLGPS